jgi:hypothetical protein
VVFTEVDFQTLRMTAKVSAAQRYGFIDAELKSEAEFGSIRKLQTGNLSHSDWFDECRSEVG